MNKESIVWPEKKKICEGQWHYSKDPSGPTPRSCPECRGIESITGILANKDWNAAIDACKEAYAKAPTLKPLDGELLMSWFLRIWDELPREKWVSNYTPSEEAFMYVTAICAKFGHPAHGKLDLSKLKKYSGIYGLPAKEYTLVNVEDLEQFSAPSQGVNEELLEALRLGLKYAINTGDHKATDIRLIEKAIATAEKGKDL